MKDEWWDALPERMGAAFEMVGKVILYGAVGFFFLAIVLGGIAALYETISDPENRQEVQQEIQKATDEVGEALDTTVGDFIRDSVGYCEDLKKALEYDWKCIASDDCVMTRDELVAYEERLGYLGKYCMKED